MIRRLEEADRTQALAYLYNDSTYNIFIIGDIEQFGFDQPFQQLYGAFDSNGAITGIFLRYRDNGVYYSQNDGFNDEFMPIINQYTFEHFSGIPYFLDAIQKHLPMYKKREMYFCEWVDQPVEESSLPVPIKTVQTKEDCAKLYDLLATIDDFGIDKQDKSTFVQNKMESMIMSTTLVIEENNQVVATVATTAETTVNAMVVAVATAESHRNRGYATHLMKALQRIYHQKQKNLCLFYDNPKAGAIYHRLGFETIGPWAMLERR